MNQCLMLSPPYKPLTKLYPWPGIFSSRISTPTLLNTLLFPTLGLERTFIQKPNQALSLRLGPLPQLPYPPNAPHSNASMLLPLVLMVWGSPVSVRLFSVFRRGRRGLTLSMNRLINQNPVASPGGGQQCLGTYQPAGHLKHRPHGHYVFGVVIQGQLKAPPQHGEHQKSGRHEYLEGRREDQRRKQNKGH